jgi:hypothetical protein
VEVDGEIVVQEMDWSEMPIPIRIRRIGNTYKALYSYDGIEWLEMPNSVTVDWASPRIGLTAFDPQRVDGGVKGAYFEYFRISYP